MKSLAAVIFVSFIANSAITLAVPTTEISYEAALTWKQLHKESKVAFTEVPVREAVDWIHDFAQYKDRSFNLNIDQKYLTSVGFDVESPLTLQTSRPVSMVYVLQHLSRKFPEIGFRVTDEGSLEIGKPTATKVPNLKQAVAWSLLQKPASADFIGNRLIECLDFLEDLASHKEATRLLIEVDWAALEKARVRPDQVVHYKASKISTLAILKALWHKMQIPLDYTIEETKGALLLSSK